MQFDGDPHILPVDIPDDELNVVKRDALGLNGLLDQLSGRADLTVAVFDACREIPNYQREIKKRTRGGSEAGWRGLSRPKVQVSSTLIAYSGGSGELVADGTGRNSPYTGLLLEHLQKSKLRETGYDVPQVFQEVSWAFPQRHSGQRPEVIVQGVRPNAYYLASAPTIASIPALASEPVTQSSPRPATASVSTTQAPAPAPDVVKPLTTGRLTVNVEPADARVRIMNIVPRYQAGIELEKNREYDVEVTKSGYETWRKSIVLEEPDQVIAVVLQSCLLYTSPSPRDATLSRMPSSA